MKLPSRRALLLVVGGSALLTTGYMLGGCAVLADVSEGRREYEAGWRSGTVSKVESAGALPSRQHWATDCRASEPAASAQQPYALVEYHRHHSRWSRIVPVPSGMSLAAGDLVRVNVKRCDSAIKPLTSTERSARGVIVVQAAARSQ